MGLTHRCLHGPALQPGSCLAIPARFYLCYKNLRVSISPPPSSSFRQLIWYMKSCPFYFYKSLFLLIEHGTMPTVDVGLKMINYLQISKNSPICQTSFFFFSRFVGILPFLSGISIYLNNISLTFQQHLSSWKSKMCKHLSFTDVSSSS